MKKCRCGESDVRVLEFDHVGDNKVEEVATLRCQEAREG